MPFDPNSPFGPAGADGIDDWFVPGQSPSRIAPWSPQTDHFFPDDWFYPDNRNAPARTAAPSTAPLAPSPQPDANPATSNRPAPPPDPFAAYWALVPASRLTAVAWHPPIFPSSNPFSLENIPASNWVAPLPIFPNSLGQYPLPAPAPTNVSPDAAGGGLLGGIPKMLAAQADPAADGLLGGIPKMLAAKASEPAANGLLGGIARLPYVPPDAPSNGLLGGRSWLPQSSPGSVGLFPFPPQQQSASAQPVSPSDSSVWPPASSPAFRLPGGLSQLESLSPDSGSLPSTPQQQSASAPAVSPLGRSPTEGHSTGEIAGDVAKSFGVGMGRFGIQAAGSLGDAREMLASGAQRVADYVAPGSAPNAGSKVSEFLASYPLLAGPTSSQLQSAVESYTGPLYQPKTIYGDYAQTAGEFVPGALLMPEGSLAINALRYGLVPALSSETAGQLTKGTAAEPWARTFGAILGAAPSALRSLPWARSAPGIAETAQPRLPPQSEVGTKPVGEMPTALTAATHSEPSSVTNLSAPTSDALSPSDVATRSAAEGELAPAEQFAAQRRGQLEESKAAGAEIENQTTAAEPASVPSTPERLQMHVDNAGARLELEGLTDNQKASLNYYPRLEAAHKGERIDTFAKESIAKDDSLRHLIVTPRFQFGPDIYDPINNVWYDITTSRQWPAHEAKYTLGSGQGTPLFYGDK